MNKSPESLLHANNLEKTLENGWQSYYSVQKSNEATKALKFEEAEKCFKIVVAETLSPEQYISAIGGLVLLTSSETEATGLYTKGLARINAWFAAIEDPDADDRLKKMMLVFEITDRYADFYYPIDPVRSKEMSSAAVQEAGKEVRIAETARKN